MTLNDYWIYVLTSLFNLFLDLTNKEGFHASELYHHGSITDDYLNYNK